MSLQIYRSTTIGVALDETLEELLVNCKITHDSKRCALVQFDKSISAMLQKYADIQVYFSVGNLQGYRCINEVWTFLLKDVIFYFREGVKTVDEVKMITCVGKKKNHYS